MKILLDFLPVIVFFVVYKITGDIILATGILIPATLAQMAYTWFKTHRIEKMQLVTLILVILLGSATIIFKDKTFIQWKPTIVNWLFGIACLGSHFIGNKTLIQRLMESSIELAQETWRRLNMGWVLFFSLTGVVNLIVAYSFSESVWVNFKLFGILGMTLLFVLAQGIYISRHLPQQNKPE